MKCMNVYLKKKKELDDPCNPYLFPEKLEVHHQDTEQKRPNIRRSWEEGRSESRHD